MDQKEWKAVARHNGFDELMVVSVDGGWRLAGSFQKGSPVLLPTKRGQPRLFASLDTIARFLNSLSVGNFKVYQLLEDDLFA